MNLPPQKDLNNDDPNKSTPKRFNLDQRLKNGIGIGVGSANPTAVAGDDDKKISSHGEI